MNQVQETMAEYVGPTPPGETPMARLMSVGTSALSTMELLGLVIGKSIQDAQHIMSQFSDLSSLGRANVAELQLVYGVGPALAARVLAAFELGRRNLSSFEERPQIRSPSDAYNLVGPEMQDLEQEHMRLILLDTKNYVIAMPTLYIGSVNTSLVRTAEMFRLALKHNAVAMIVVHNHPSGDPTPSPEDVSLTTKVVEAGRYLDVEVLDHAIIGKGIFVSLKERGLGGLS